MPILTMLETIRRQLMARYVKRLEFSEKFKGTLCPNIAKKLGFKLVNTRGMEVIYSGGTLFEVTSPEKTCVVDIGEHTCTFRKWDVSGIPCNHACATIMTHKRKPEEYVHDCYTTETFIKVYNHRMHPIPDKTLWPKTAFDPIEPPPFRATSGRPKKARKKGEDEEKNPFKVRKHHITLRCRQCGAFGHNRRTCKKPLESWVKNTYYGRGGGRSVRGGGRSARGGRSGRGGLEQLEQGAKPRQLTYHS